MWGIKDPMCVCGEREKDVFNIYICIQPHRCVKLSILLPYLKWQEQAGAGGGESSHSPEAVRNLSLYPLEKKLFFGEKDQLV